MKSPTPAWSRADTPGLSVVIPSFARPENVPVALAYLLRLPALQHAASEVLIAHGSERSYELRGLIDAAVQEVCGAGAVAAAAGAAESGRALQLQRVRPDSALERLGLPHPEEVLGALAARAEQFNLAAVLVAQRRRACPAPEEGKVRHRNRKEDGFMLDVFRFHRV